MILSQSAEYALRIMACLAIQSQNGPLRARDLATQTQIPTHYISKVLRKMVEAKLLAATKGHQGGFQLALSPSKVRFVDILNAIGLVLKPKHCLFGWRTCSDRRPCILHHRWKEVSDTFRNWAEKTSLADIQCDVEKHGYSSFFAQLQGLQGENELCMNNHTR